MAAPPYMKLFVADYLADTTHLSTAQHGAYMLLLMAMWRAGGRLPAHDGKLAAISKMTAREWAANRETVLDFFQRRGGQLTHKRLAAEMAKADHVSGVRKQASERAVSEKRKKNSDEAPPNGAPNGDQLGTYIRHQSQKITPPSPLPGGERSRAFEEAWRKWHAGVPANRGKDQAWVAWQAAAGSMAEANGGEATLLQCVDTHLARLAESPRQTRKAFHRWLRDRAFEAYLRDISPPSLSWNGPPEVWDFVASPPRDGGYARSWLGRCTWSDVPRAITGGRTCIDRLREDLGREFEDRGIELRERAA